MVERKSYTLNTGAKIPAVGLGTWQSPRDQTRAAVIAALRAGYRHIDTAAAYQNEVEVGEGIRDSGIPRTEIFLTTKLFNDSHHRAAEALDESLQKLGTDYLDLYLVHWPVSIEPGTGFKKTKEGWNFVKTYLEMQKLAKTGKVRAIGVSNHQIYHLEELFKHPEFEIVPAVNQIELHPYNPSPKLVEYCRQKGIHVTGYSPLGSSNSPLLKERALEELSEKYKKSPAQILLNWGLGKGWSVIPKSVTESRIIENFDVEGWELSKEDLDKLSGLTKRQKVCSDGWLPVKVFTGDDE